MSSVSSNIGLILPEIEDQIHQTIMDLYNNFSKLDEIADIYMDEAPASGFWKISRRVYKKNPSIGDYVGWVNLREGMAAPVWNSLTSYSVGDLIIPPNDNGHYYECVQSGYSGVNVPSFPTISGETVRDIYGYSYWTPSKNYNEGDIVLPSIENNRFYVCTVAGLSGISEPTWTIVDGESVNDNQVVWVGYRIVTWKEKGVAAHFRPFGKIE